MSRSIKLSMAALIATLSLLTFFTNCSTQNTTSFDLLKRTNTSTVGNPFSTSTSKLTEAICRKVASCHTQANLSSCEQALETSSAYISKLGLSTSSYSSISQVERAEVTGALPQNLSNASSCLSAVENLTCSDSVVQSAFVSSSYSQAAELASQQDCSRVFVAGKNIEVPIELIDRGISSNQSVTTFNRSQTSFDSSDYDGSVSYKVEVIAANSSTSTQTFSLVNSAGDILANINVPSGTNSPTRFESFATMPQGKSVLRLRLSATPTRGTFQVYSARLKVRQIEATRTKIYIPLINGYQDDTSFNDNSNGRIDHSSSPTLTQNNPHYFSLWVKSRNSYNLSQFQSSALPWTFEAVMSADPNSQMQVMLVNADTNAVVSDSVVMSNSGAPQLVNKSFSNSAQNFSDESRFEVRHTRDMNSTGMGYLYKAGLWVQLQDLSLVEVQHRIAGTIWSNTNNSYVLDSSFLKYDLSFSPQLRSVHYEATGYLFSPGGQCGGRLEIKDSLVASSIGTQIASTYLQFNTINKVLRQSSDLSLNNQDTFTIRVDANQSTSSCIMSMSKLVLRM